MKRIYHLDKAGNIIKKLSNVIYFVIIIRKIKNCRTFKCILEYE